MPIVSAVASSASPQAGTASAKEVNAKSQCNINNNSNPGTTSGGHHGPATNGGVSVGVSKMCARSPVRNTRRVSLDRKGNSSLLTLGGVEGVRGYEGIENVLTELATTSYDNRESPITLDILIDVFLKTSVNIGSRGNENSIGSLKCPKGMEYLQKRSSSASDFEVIRLLSKGSVAHVYLVVEKRTGIPLAMKKMRKVDLLSTSQIVNYRNELDLLTKHCLCSSPNDAAKNLSRLHYAFHDEHFTYLILDFYAGGDLLGLLGKFDCFSEDMSRVYMAQLVQAVGAVHDLGYAHMDIQSENVLLNEFGHVILADFGSCIALEAKKGLFRDGYTKKGQSYGCAAGAPDYLAPELLDVVGSQGSRVSEISLSLCDWWSVGVVFYEMLYGETPFYSDSVLEIYKNVRNFSSSLRFNDENVTICREARNLIEQLLTDCETRIGRGGVIEIQKHTYFENINWNNLNSRKAPFVPELASNMDCAFFEEYQEEEEEGFKSPPTKIEKGLASGLNNPSESRFWGYYFNSRNYSNSKSTPFIKRSGGRFGLASNFVPQMTMPKPEVTTEAESDPRSVKQPLSTQKEVPEEESPLRERKSTQGKRVQFPPDVVFFDSARMGDLPTLIHILNSKANDVHIDDCTLLGQSALHLACLEGHLDVIKHLLELGASVDLCDDQMYTPLHCAALEDRIEPMKLLIKFGADPNAKNIDGESALDLISEEHLSNFI
eukprot:Nk52_evm24s1020 gene=Nk52_evmTU24s1020